MNASLLLAVLFGALTLIPLAPAAAQTARGEALAQQAGCLRCHAVDRRRSGPAFTDVAARLRDQPNVRAELSARLRAGRGHPVVRTDEATLNEILDWVLTR